MTAETHAYPTGARRNLIVLVAIGGGWVFEFIWSIAGVALPHMQGSFSATSDQISWIMTSFLMGAVTIIACTGWLASRFGRKQMFLLSLFGFSVTLVMCGTATSIEAEVGWRLVQGIFGAPLMPLSQAIVVDQFPPERHGSATAMWTFGIIGGGVFAPAAGGAIVEFMSWPWVFYLNLPLTALVFVLAMFVLPSTEPDPDNKMDWHGLLAIVISVTALQIACTRGQRLDWFDSYEIMIECTVAAVALYYFIVHSLTTANPFFRPALFLDKNFNLGLLAALANGAIATLPLVVLPIMLEDLAGYPVLDTGILLISRGVGIVIISAVLARYDHAIPPKPLLLVSFVAALISGYMMAEWTADVSAAEVFWVNVVQGIASGAIFICINTLTFATLPSHLKTEGFALYYTVLFTGASVGIAIIVTILSRMTQVAHTVVGAHVNPFNERFRFAGVPSDWDLTELNGLLALEAEVQRQAESIAYSDAFLATALISLVGIPLTLMFSSPKR
jgi:DHA2 family multidrug resistance protein